ncbi:pyridine nucleotide-disulfide oxidoreductase [Alkalicaulis satelles]|uniref:Pyridine nucleotide-disulfide oxidoreductase n=1 Tax=Alkalicaulis satelles TaxID=2609175 RepID=A0A5M6ZFZ2_9PROT|nr:FAD-dependent oxidoreductase [Alkalicaulis satelles]KAA5803663.1 pyridine nucleotide-disulfide oxidoreductase [Alkalicaulis satelles]
MSAGIVIIGAGQAGLSAAEALRRRGHAGPVTLVGEEDAPPYQRPPLSKAYLSGELPADRLWLKPPAFYETAKIDLKTGVRVTAIDRAKKRVITAEGEAIAYDQLIVSTGGAARRPPIPGADLPGVHVLRTLAEADALSGALGQARRLVIIGAGYIGLEVAASARKRGLDVAVFEAADQAMARTASPLLGGWFGALHRGYGVDLQVRAGVAAITGAERADGVRLADGERVEADVVLLATGLTPGVSLAEAAGLNCADGVLVDGDARTSDPDIFAIGDVARFDSALYGRSLRLESVQNAIEQAKAAAAAITGAPASYDPVPWFWSDQYDLKLQIAGLIEGADQMVRRGDPEEGHFALFHFKDGVLIACEAVNRAPEFMAAQRLIAARARPDPDRLRDVTVAMREFLS